MARARSRRSHQRRWRLSLDMLIEMDSAGGELTDVDRRDAFMALREQLAPFGACGAFWEYEPDIPDDLRIEVPYPDVRLHPNDTGADPTAWEAEAAAARAHEWRRLRFLETHDYPEAAAERQRWPYAGPTQGAN